MATYGADLTPGLRAVSAYLVGDSLVIVVNQPVVGYRHRAVTLQLNGEFTRGSMTALAGATSIVVLHDTATAMQHFLQVLRFKEQHSE